MGVHSFLKSALKASMSTFDAEEITIGSTKLKAIIDEATGSNPLGTGATNNERTMTIQFPADSFTGKLKSGMKV